MAGRRWKRFSRDTTKSPLRDKHSSLYSNTTSCWYREFKIHAFNLSLFRFGRTHSRLLQMWFSIGVGFSLTAVIATTMFCAWESANALHLFGNNAGRGKNWSALLFGFSTSVSGLRISLADFVYVALSSVVSIAVHEFGHAVAAASEGIQVEYIAIFVAALCPGVLVALTSELLEALPSSSALRIYCAGIWHNAVCCAVCALSLLFLPVILYPFYIHGENPMVLDVSPNSPLSAHLAPGDVIVSMDGVPIHNPQEWREIIALKNVQALGHLNASNDYNHLFEIIGREGFCVPIPLIEESERFYMTANESACPAELGSFTRLSCSDSIVMEGNSKGDDQYGESEVTHCLNIDDIISLKKCGNGQETIITGTNDCVCQEGESCLSPINVPGMTWVTIKYSSPYSRNCLQVLQDSSQGANMDEDDNVKTKCGGTLVFIGNAISLSRLVWLTAYRPRWSFFIAASIPNVLEKILKCTFHVSLALALLNSLPVRYFDGEAILEASLSYFAFLRPKRKRKVLKVCLSVGAIISVIAFFRIILFPLFSSKLNLTTTFSHNIKEKGRVYVL